MDIDFKSFNENPLSFTYNSYSDRVKLNNSSSGAAILVFITYALTQIWVAILPKTSIIQISIILFVMTFLVFDFQQRDIRLLNITRIDVYWLIGWLIIIVSLARTSLADYIVDIYFYTSGIAFMLLAKDEIDSFGNSFLVIKYISICYALGTFWQYFFTGSFKKIIFPIIPDSASDRALELIRDNYYPGFGMGMPAIGAGCMVLGLGIILSFWRDEKRKQKVKNIFYFLFLYVGIIMVGKRSILLWASVACIVTVFIINKEKGYRVLLRKSFILFLAIILLLFITLHFFEDLPFLTRIIKTFNGLLSGDDVTSGRTKLYHRAWEMFKENPVLGVGWNQFEVLTSGFLSRDLSVHNVYLQLLSETGIIGFIFIILPLFYTYYRTYKSFKLIQKTYLYSNSLWRGGVCFSLYYQTFFLLYCLTENPLYNIVFMFIYFFSISIPNSFLTRNNV